MYFLIYDRTVYNIKGMLLGIIYNQIQRHLNSEAEDKISKFLLLELQLYKYALQLIICLQGLNTVETDNK